MAGGEVGNAHTGKFCGAGFKGVEVGVIGEAGVIAHILEVKLLSVDRAPELVDKSFEAADVVGVGVGDKNGTDGIRRDAVGPEGFGDAFAAYAGINENTAGLVADEGAVTAAGGE